MADPSSPDPVTIPPEVRIFFRDIKEHPDDDTPRLIFADWLQEHGDAAAAARGEFLRLQVLRHRLTPDDSSYGLLKRREGELFTANRWTWLGPLRDAATWTFERGMIQITARAERILTTEIADWARTEAGLWSDALSLNDVKPVHVNQLAGSPLLAHVNVLDLSANRLQAGFRRLFRSPRLAFVTRLCLAHNRLTFNHIAWLKVSSSLQRLMHLDLQYNHLNDFAAELLAGASSLQKLTSLRLAHNRFTAEGVAILRQSFGDRVLF